QLLGQKDPVCIDREAHSVLHDGVGELQEIGAHEGLTPRQRYCHYPTGTELLEEGDEPRGGEIVRMTIAVRRIVRAVATREITGARHSDVHVARRAPEPRLLDRHRVTSAANPMSQRARTKDSTWVCKSPASAGTSSNSSRSALQRSSRV